MRKNEETEKIMLADYVRDKALEAFRKALRLYALSDDEAEVEASRGLGILFGPFKNLATLNYEAEPAEHLPQVLRRSAGAADRPKGR